MTTSTNNTQTPVKRMRVALSKDLYRRVVKAAVDADLTPSDYVTRVVEQAVPENGGTP